MTPGGMLMEDYRPLLMASPKVADALTDVLAVLITDPRRRRQLSETARRDVETKFSLESWNLAVARAFDRALA